MFCFKTHNYLCSTKGYLFSLFLLLFLSFVFYPCWVYSWPASNAWIPVSKNESLLQDPLDDAQDAGNVVSDSSHAAAFIFNDGLYIYFRMRQDSNPAGTDVRDHLKQYGWSIEIDTDSDAGNYEFMVMLDGISSLENIKLWTNTIQENPGDPSDEPENLLNSVPVSANYQINIADTSFNGDQDYFIDWRFPYDTFKMLTGLSDYSPVRLFLGTSSNADSLDETGADIIGPPDLYSGFSDYLIPLGTKAASGAALFVGDILGAGDVTQTDIGNIIYLRVDDPDQNYDSASIQSVTVNVSTTSGDSEDIALTETEVNTGIFTGQIFSAPEPIVSNDGKIEPSASQETVQVTYIDNIDESLNLDQPRTDILILLSPAITVEKTSNPNSISSGSTLTYTVTITNEGFADGNMIMIKDDLPAGFSYLPNTASGLTINEPLIDGQSIIWNDSWIVSKQGGVATLSFQVKAVNVRGEYFNNLSVHGSNFAAIVTGDTAPVIIKAPVMQINKDVSRHQAAPGEELIYSIHYRNLGDGSAHSLILIDSIPTNTTYIPNSLRKGEADSTYETASIITDGLDDDEGEAEIEQGRIIFRLNMVSPDNGVPNSGTDEAKIYFKVRVN